MAAKMKGGLLTCPECGASASAADRVQTGDMVSFHCPSCDKKWSWTVCYPPPELHDDSKVRALLRWRGTKPTPRELSGVRQLVPQFLDLGLLDVMEAVKGKSFWDLGVFPRPYAMADLMCLVKEKGLTLELQELEAQS